MDDLYTALAEELDEHRHTVKLAVLALSYGAEVDDNEIGRVVKRLRVEVPDLEYRVKAHQAT